MKSKLAIFIILSVLMLLSVFAIQYLFKVREPNEQFEVEEIATDPKFHESKEALLPGFPDFPVFPEATLAGSAYTNTIDQPVDGYHVMWNTQTPVPEVMEWYMSALEDTWQVEPPNDTTSPAEQVAQIKNAEFEGYIAAEDEAGTTQIVVDIKKL